MTEQQKIVPRKYGEGTEWEFGAHWRLTIDCPLSVTTKWMYDETPYSPGVEKSSVRIEKVQLHRPTLEELFPYIKAAVEQGDEFKIEHMADGRSDPRGYDPIPQPELVALVIKAVGAQRER